MTYTVYAIKSISKDYIYVWMTNDLEKRLDEHNKGKTKSNKYYAPFKLLYQENQPTRVDARNREKQLKSWYWKEWLKTLL